MLLSFRPAVRLRLSLAFLLLLLCAGGSRAAASTPNVGASDEFLYTVRPGDSAWTVTARYLRDASLWEGLRQTNQLRGDRLRPGQVLRIPTPWLRLTTPQARLAALQGEVMLNGGSGWAPARADTVLPPGTWLRTAASGTATLVLQDGTRVLVRPASELRLVPVDRAQVEAWFQAQTAGAPPSASTSAATASDTPPTAPVRIELLRGGLENAVQPQSGNGRFEVRTPTAVTTVRGTEFRLTVEPEGSRAEVVHGAVGFGNAQGQVALATATGARTTTADTGPSAPVVLLPAPDLSALPDPVAPAQLAQPVLPALAGAVAYRTQWLTESPAEQLLLEQRHATPQPPDPALPDGRYRLRLRAIDADGFEGLGAERTLTLRTPPPAPPPPPPPPGLTARRVGPRLRLQWAPVSAGNASQVQVARDAGFTRLVLDEPTPHDRLDLPAPPPDGQGPYHLRVRVLQPEGGRSGWSEPRVFDPRSPEELLP